MKKFLIVLSLLGAAGARAKNPVFFSIGDRRGEVSPCGCPRIQLGGLTRLVAFVDSEKKNAPFLVDSGNSFFSLPVLPDSRIDSELRKAKLIAEAYKMLGVALLVPGSRDFAQGIEKLRALAKEANLPLVSANLTDETGKPLFDTTRIEQRGKFKVGFSGVSDSAVPFEGARLAPLGEATKNALKALRQQEVDLAVLVVQGPGDLNAARESAFDLVLSAPSKNEGKTVSMVKWDPTVPVQAIHETDLVPEWEKGSRFAKNYQRYLKDVRQVAIDTRVPSMKKGKGDFVAQAGKCAECHTKQTEFWNSTKHASAYLVLFARNQHFNPECIGCHSLGYGKPGGFDDITAPIRLKGERPREKGETPFVERLMAEVFEKDPGKGPLDSRADPARYAVLKKRFHEKIGELQKDGKIEALHMGVQCEHCHGNRNGHPGTGFKKAGAVKVTSCLHCHVPPHDESFDFARRVKMVACPRL